MSRQQATQHEQESYLEPQTWTIAPRGGGARLRPLTGPAIDGQPIQLSAADGFGLAATLFVPRHDNETVVLICPATAVVRRIYAPLAGYLAERGCTVLTWDWRGTGESRPATLRGFAATMREWAERDLAGVIAWAARQFPGKTLTALGHSFGGQAFGLTPSAARLERLVTIGAQVGYVGHWPRRTRAALRVLWHAVVPALSHLVGYFPAHRLGLGEDLPKGVALQWARWCTSRNYHGDFAGYARLAVPLLAYSIEDDWIAPVPAVDALHRAYSRCHVSRRHLTPVQFGVQRIGHFGLFRQGVAPAVWDSVARWLEDPVGAHAPPA